MNFELRLEKAYIKCWIDEFPNLNYENCKTETVRIFNKQFQKKNITVQKIAMENLFA